jgi:hypothetical protein
LNEDTSFRNRRLKELLEARPFGTTTHVLTFRDSHEAVTYKRFLDYPSERKSIVVYRKIPDPTITN